MRANEFVKKFGWEKVKHCNKPSSRDNFFIVGGEVIRDQELKDLKRLVESWELVERVISSHNKSFKECQIDIHGLKSLVKKNPKIYPKRLKQAIADVESCQ